MSVSEQDLEVLTSFDCGQSERTGKYQVALCWNQPNLCCSNNWTLSLIAAIQPLTLGKLTGLSTWFIIAKHDGR